MTAASGYGRLVADTAQGSGPPPGPRISVRSGNLQGCRADRPFNAQLVAEVTDASGDPLPGMYVTFRVTSGPASFGRGSRVSTARTDAAGHAVSAVVVAGLEPGGVQVTASTGHELRPATFTLRVIREPGGRPRPGSPVGPTGVRRPPAYPPIRR